MKPFYLILISFFILLGFSPAQAKKWQTQQDGYWGNAAVWRGNTAPSYSSGDTIVIRHYVALDHNLDLTSWAYLSIDSFGGICGHHNIALTEAQLHKYGFLEIDTLSLQSATADLYQGETIFTYSAHLSGAGARLSTHAATLKVGPWFNCELPQYEYTGIGDTKEKRLGQLHVFPNPSQEFITVSGFSAALRSIVLYDLNGRVAMRYDTQTGELQGLIRLDVSALAGGVYQCRLTAADGAQAIAKIVISR